MGRVGVLLLNLGGPERPQDVRPFLYNLFSDPEILRLPAPWLQAPLAWLISTLRFQKSRKNYQKIGGGSPLRQITEAQALALQRRLQTQEQSIKVYVGMRYWHPFTQEAISQIKRDNIERLVILPLYPQFSISTSGSSFRELERLWQEDPQLQDIQYTVVPSWYHNPTYIRAMAALIEKTMAQVDDPQNVHVFFSAHGVPVSYVEEAGDPYQREIEGCAQLIMQALKRSNPYTLAYQSRVGPVEWLQPYTNEAIQELADQGTKELVVVPISFVSEHIETLEEIDIEYREVALEAGIKTFARVPAPDTDPVFIQALEEIVTQSLEEPPTFFSETVRPQKSVKLYPQERWTWGITTSAEVWNGRLAMLGLVAVLVEVWMGLGPFHLLGFM
ncbi:Ferrochelatase [Acaryochloris thomasi RCC1774]|uniref:Ferrochelatase n=1 Tax=Acaryochloris thomasi RCC1774 TaxID=1764569 RepID=A0A2W1JKP0_9CYAN|nr:ferrochelatase [Acaryochloris thomasi]PZD70764.1 Ferrochelatase [Acaryochloris thomasi RCC1774]